MRLSRNWTCDIGPVRHPRRALPPASHGVNAGGHREEPLMRTAASADTVRSVLDLDALESQAHSVRWPVLLAELVVVVQLLVVVVDSDLRMPGILVPVAIVGLLSAV